MNRLTAAPTPKAALTSFTACLIALTPKATHTHAHSLQSTAQHCRTPRAALTTITAHLIPPTCTHRAEGFEHLPPTPQVVGRVGRGQYHPVAAPLEHVHHGPGRQLHAPDGHRAGEHTVQGATVSVDGGRDGRRADDGEQVAALAGPDLRPPACRRQRDGAGNGSGSMQRHAAGRTPRNTAACNARHAAARTLQHHNSRDSLLVTPEVDGDVPRDVDGTTLYQRHLLAAWQQGGKGAKVRKAVTECRGEHVWAAGVVGNGRNVLLSHCNCSLAAVVYVAALAR